MDLVIGLLIVWVVLITIFCVVVFFVTRGAERRLDHIEQCGGSRGEHESVDWATKDRPWSEYPVGTKAWALGGGYWIRVPNGWKWHNGDTFPTPGGDATGRVTLPPKQAKAAE